MAGSVKSVVANLFAACRDSVYNAATDTMGAPVLVSYGPPNTYNPGAIVSVGMDLRQPITRPTLGTNRSRETLLEVDVVISVYVAGGEEAQQTATEAAIDLQGLLQTYLRTSPNERLSGACEDSFVSDVKGPTPSVAYDQASGAAMGRIAESTVTVTARVRF